MKTDDLIEMLVAGSNPVAAGTARRRFAVAFGWGGLGALFLVATVLGVRQDLARMALDPMFWAKLAYCGALSVTALIVVSRLSRPGALAGRAAAALALPLVAMWLLAALALEGAGAPEREALVFGTTWRSCAFNIAFVSLPLFAALLWAIKGLAPTRLALAGAAAGLLSGAAAALIYSLHCPELGAPFLGIWYLLGMLLPSAAGAIIGPRVLRW